MKYLRAPIAGLVLIMLLSVIKLRLDQDAAVDPDLVSVYVGGLVIAAVSIIATALSDLIDLWKHNPKDD